MTTTQTTFAELDAQVKRGIIELRMAQIATGSKLEALRNLVWELKGQAESAHYREWAEANPDLVAADAKEVEEYEAQY